MSNVKNIFNEKGSAAEAIIADLCKDAFFQDFCFRNPYHGHGKDRKELCDVLVVLNNVVIIWQIKNIKLSNDGHFKESDIKKGVSQSRGARKTILALDNITLTNVAGVEKILDLSVVKEVFMITAIEGGTEDFGHYYDENASRGNVHIFYEKFTRFATKHLNTVTDFVTYLRAKEAFMTGKGVIITGGEENLLALFLNNARSFGKADDPEVNNVFFDIEGMAEELENDPDYKDKLDADYWSQGWDLLIEKKRAAIAHDGSHDDAVARDKFLAKMMSHSRFERRNLGKMFYDAAVEALKGPNDESFVYRRYYAADGVTYVFAFMGSIDSDHTARRNMLYVAALAARLKIERNTMVIAVVTEKDLVKNTENGFDWVLLDMNEDQVKAEVTPEIRDVMIKGGFLQNPKVEILSSYEYPSDVPEHLRSKT